MTFSLTTLPSPNTGLKRRELDSHLKAQRPGQWYFRPGR